MNEYLILKTSKNLKHGQSLPTQTYTKCYILNAECLTKVKFKHFIFQGFEIVQIISSSFSQNFYL